MKNYLLTDFTTDRWLGINHESLEKQIKELKDRLDNYGCIYGELGNPDNADVSLSRASHSIQSLTYVNGKIYGDVKILDTKHGKIAKTFGDNIKFGIRSIGTTSNDTIDIKKIFTWDIINE